MKPVDFRTSFYFPGMVVLFGWVLFLIGSILLFVKLIPGIVLLALGMLIFTTHYRLKVDLERKTFQEYVWVAGFKSGDKKTFETIEYLYITKGTISQTMHSKVSSSTFWKEVYNGFLKFSEEQKIHLFEDERKDHLIEKLKVISKELNLDIVDRS